MALTRDQLLALSDDAPTAEVELPNGGGSVKVKAISSGERFRIARLSGNNDKIDPNSLMVVFGAVGEDGKRLFPQVQDVDAVAALPAGTVDAIVDKISELSGMDDKAPADAEGNSDGTLSGSSSSSSPETSDAPSPS